MFTKIRCMQKPVYWLRVFVITQSNNAYCDFEMYYTGVLYVILLSLKRVRFFVKIFTIKYNKTLSTFYDAFDYITPIMIPILLQ